MEITFVAYSMPEQTQHENNLEQRTKIVIICTTTSTQTEE
jgi:hypothetical protein